MMSRGAIACRLAAAARLTPARTLQRFQSGAAAGDVVGIDLGTTNSCVAIMEVRPAAGAGRRLAQLRRADGGGAPFAAAASTP